MNVDWRHSEDMDHPAMMLLVTLCGSGTTLFFVCECMCDLTSEAFRMFFLLRWKKERTSLDGIHEKAAVKT